MNQSAESEELNCGQMTKAELVLWMNVQFWTEGILFSIVGAIGFIGNIISIGILLTKDMKKHSFNQMLIGLAFFDLSFILCGVPVHITPIFGLENRLYALLYAYFLYPFTAVSLTGSIYMTMAITIERFMAVCHPHYYRDVNSRITPLKRVLTYAFPVTTFAVIVNIPKFLETKVHYDNEGEVHYDVTELRLNPTYIWWYTLSYVCHPLLTTTVGPFCLLTVLNTRIYRGIKKARTNVSSSNRHGEMNLARVLVTICVVFLLCNSLRLFLGLQAIINVDITITCVSNGKAWIPPSWMLIMESISHLLLLISSSSNFLIYCTISTKFKIYIKTKFFWRSSPLVDVPEVNSRIAMRTLNGKSANDGSGSQARLALPIDAQAPNLQANGISLNTTALPALSSANAAAPDAVDAEIAQEEATSDNKLETAANAAAQQSQSKEAKECDEANANKQQESSNHNVTTTVIVETPPLSNAIDKVAEQPCTSRSSSMASCSNTSLSTKAVITEGKEDVINKATAFDEEEPCSSTSAPIIKDEEESDEESDFGFEEKESQL